MEVSRVFVSAGVNRVVNTLNWGDHYIAYGCHKSVVIYDPYAAEVVGTLVGHAGLVNCVTWLSQNVTQQVGAAVLLSGAEDNTVKVWAWFGSAADQPWQCIATLQGHTAPVTSITVHPLSASSLLVVSTAGDADVHCWRCDHLGQVPGSPVVDAFGQEQWQLQQTIPVGTQIQQCAAIATLPSSPDWLVLATGGTDNAVRLYLQPPGGQFTLACKLSGHENWVRSLAFVHVAGGGDAPRELLLASASQDRYIRVWTIKEDVHSSAGPSSGAAEPLAAMIMAYAPRPLLKAGSHSYSATLDALLIGHEDWVHSVCWHSSSAGGAAAADRSTLTLLSSSMDRTMVLWRHLSGEDIWMNETSVGDAGAQCLGYFGGLFSPDGSHIVAHGFTGALHLWQRVGSGRSSSWQPRHALGGHFGAVVDCCWGLDGPCLLSASEDQTTRIFTALAGHWCELARPQVHGHDFSCVAAIPTAADEPYKFVSGSEEKMVRAFEAPQAFLETLDMARGRASQNGAVRRPKGRSFGAALPALGLSNKAVYEEAGEEDNAGVGSGMEGGDYTEGPDFVPCAAPAVVAGPPLEEHLAQNTLWPEVQKLYGHGNDVFCMAAHPAGHLLATACKAQSAATASIWLWSVKDWKAVGQLAGHQLTVTQLAFSLDGRYLLSASRDRTFSVFRSVQPSQPPPAAADRHGTANGSAANGHTTDAAAGSSGADACPTGYELVRRVRGAHSRIVWGAAWSPDGALIATASRDQTVKLWQMKDGDVMEAAVCTLPTFPAAVTAVAFCPHHSRRDDDAAQYTLAIGLEDGIIELWSVCSQPAAGPVEAACRWHSAAFVQHAAAVRRLCWYIPTAAEDTGGLEQQGAALLGSCSEDHTVRVWNVHL